VPVQIINISFLNPIKIYSVKKILIENNVDVIIINLSRDLKFAGISAKKAKIKHIIYRRGSAIPIKNTFLNRFLFNNIVTEIIANTEATKKTILQNNKQLFKSEKIKVIYNGIDIDELYAQKQTSYYIKKKGEFVIGNLGRLEKQKAQHYLLEIASELKKRELPLFKIIIAGSGSLETMLKDKCKELNVCDVVVFTGFAEHVKGFYSDIDIFALTSIWEGFGYVLAEAMALETPVVAFNISSNPEIVDNNSSGYLVDFPDIIQFADRIENLMNNNLLRTEMGRTGKQRVLELFTFEKMKKEFKAYVKNLN